MFIDIEFIDEYEDYDSSRIVIEAKQVTSITELQNEECAFLVVEEAVTILIR